MSTKKKTTPLTPHFRLSRPLHASADLNIFSQLQSCLGGILPLFHVMAGLTNSTKPVGWDHDRDIDTSPDPSDKSDQDPKLKDFDVEGQGRRGSQHHVTAIDGSSMTESVGRQIDMESENTIKYRTCSWQKVRGDRFRKGKRLANKPLLTDRCIALLRVHLPGHHVVPLVLFNSGPGSRFDSDCCHRRYRPIHFANHLVCSHLALPSLLRCHSGYL